MEPNEANRNQGQKPTEPRIPLPPVDSQMTEGNRQTRPMIVSAQRTSRWLWVLASAGLILALASLTLNAVLFVRLRHAGDVTGRVLDEAISALDSVTGQGIDVEVPISQTIEFSSTIPFVKDFNIPFQHSITINRTVRVWVNAGILGRIPVDIPINATIPVDMNVPVHIDQGISVQTEIPLQMVIPVHLEPEEYNVDNVIQTVRRWLVTVRELM